MEQPPAGLTYQGKPRTFGVRLSHADIAVIVIGIAAGVLGFNFVGEIALFIPYVVAHFFLFCNVFRIRRSPEILWASIFLINCIAWFAAGFVNVYYICASQLLVTLYIILREIRQPCYHGIFAQRLNPKLPDYLQGKI